MCVYPQDQLQNPNVEMYLQFSTITQVWVCVYMRMCEKKWEWDSKRDNLHKDRKDAYFRKHIACILQKTAKTIVYSSSLNVSL